MRLGGLFSLVMAARREECLAWRLGSCALSSIRNRADTPDSELWPCICGLWRRVYCNSVTMGMADRQCTAGQI